MAYSFTDYLRWESTDRDKIKVKRLYVDIAGDLVAGILLSQIIYWHSPSNQDGNIRLRVRKGNTLWLAKGREEWWDECRITPRQFDRAIGYLVEKGIAEKRLFRFNGSPVVHVRLIQEKLMEHINKELANEQNPDFNKSVKSNLTKGENENIPKCKNITEITTETTTEITNNVPNRHLEDTHSALINKNILKEVLEVIEYYYSKYSELVDIDQGHPQLKAAQRKRVEGVIKEFMQANRLNAPAMRRVVDRHFERELDTDWNINHFATVGILENTAREVLGLA